MGVDWRNCPHCECLYATGSWNNTRCPDENGGCSTYFCSPECADIQKVDEAGVLSSLGYDSCRECRGENTSDTNLFAYLLEKCGILKHQLAEEYLNRKKEPK